MRSQAWCPHVLDNGGVVKDVAVIVNAGRDKSLRPDRKTLKTLKERFANDIIEIFGIQVDAITSNKAKYLVGFRSAEEIRNRSPITFKRNYRGLWASK